MKIIVGASVLLAGLFAVAVVPRKPAAFRPVATPPPMQPQQAGGHNLIYPEPTPAGYAADTAGILQALTCTLVQCPFPNCVGDTFLIQGARDTDGTFYKNGVQVGRTWGGGGSTPFGVPHRGHVLQLSNSGTGWRLYFHTESMGEGQYNSGPAQFADAGSSVDTSALTFTFNTPQGIFKWTIHD